MKEASSERSVTYEMEGGKGGVAWYATRKNTSKRKKEKGDGKNNIYIYNIYISVRERCEADS